MSSHGFDLSLSQVVVGFTSCWLPGRLNEYVTSTPFSLMTTLPVTKHCKRSNSSVTPACWPKASNFASA